MATVYLGLGSNLGNRENNIRQALEELKKQNIIIRKCAHIIETDPVGGPPQGKFLNTAAEIETHHSPTELLVILKGIEKKLGRTKAAPNSPRRIDLDILRYDDIRLHTASTIKSQFFKS